MPVPSSPTAFTVEAESGTTVARLFCARCGSPLARSPAAPALFVIKAASLDDPGWLRPSAHLWTHSAPRWASMAGDLPRFPKNFGAT